MGGVLATRVGYTGGQKLYPTYQSIGDHTEAVQIEYDPSRISYAQLLDHVWRSGAPRRPAHCSQYKSAVWWHDESQRAELEHRVAADTTHGRSNNLTLDPLPPFYRAEEYHQQYVEKHSGRGGFYGI